MTWSVRSRDGRAARAMVAASVVGLLAFQTSLLAADRPGGAGNAKHLREAIQRKALRDNGTLAPVEAVPGAVSAGVLGACCPTGTSICSVDLDEMTCLTASGVWNAGASCFGTSGLPLPICGQIGCGFDNGPLLDRGGAVLTSYAPDTGAAAAAVDDFVLNPLDGLPCRITGIRSWMTHNDTAVFPTSHYQGVNVTIYSDAGLGLATTGPAGVPASDGSHTRSFLGGIVYSQHHPMSTLSAAQQLGICFGLDLWKIDIPVDIVLQPSKRYWLEVQPIMDAAIGQAFRVLSENSNGPRALRIAPVEGVADWTVISGNTASCAAMPLAGTRTDLAFKLFGEALGTPPNDNCANKVTVSDGVVAFNTLGALTDGPVVPASCDLGLSTQVRQDVWFDYTASCSGNLTMSLCGGAFDSELVVYRECGVCPPLTDPVACNEDSGAICGNQAQVTIPTTAGTCYTLRVGGFFDNEGRGMLTIDCDTPGPAMGACCSESVCGGTLTEPQCTAKGGNWFVGQDCANFACPITNDDCNGCSPIFTNDVVRGSTSAATGATVSSCGTGDVKDVWHCWTADCDGAAVIGLCDSTFDTTLAVFDACGGNELICNDDHCTNSFTRSELDPTNRIEGLVLPVTNGQTYYIRVSGFNGSSGDYTLTVDSCVSGCCSPNGQCSNVDAATCAASGTPLPAGSLCQGDSDGNRKDDACETCPIATIDLLTALPANGTVDARQPYAPGSVFPRQGIGSPGAVGSDREPIILTLNPPVTGAASCFALCETAFDQLLGVNNIAQTIDRGDGSYEIVLAQAITAGAVTTIEFMGDGSSVSYISHPANVDADALASSADITAHISCCVLGECVPTWGLYSCDVDHSGGLSPADMLRVIDLLNGAELLTPWDATPRPQNTTCP